MCNYDIEYKTKIKYKIQTATYKLINIFYKMFGNL